MKKQPLSLVLALLLVFSLLPGSAFAASAECIGASEPRSIVELEEERPTVWQSVDLSDYITRVGGMQTLEATAFQSSTAAREEFDRRIEYGLQCLFEEIDISDLELSLEECAYRYYGLVHTHPEFFYVNVIRGFSYLTGFRDDEEIIFAIRPVYSSDYDDRDRALFSAICNRIIHGMPDGTDTEKMLYLHDYIITHCQYNSDPENENIFNAYNSAWLTASRSVRGMPLLICISAS